MKESSILNIQKQNKTEELNNCRIESGKNKMNIKSFSCKTIKENSKINTSPIIKKLNFNNLNKTQIKNKGRNNNLNSLNTINLKIKGNFSTFNSTLFSEEFKSERSNKKIIRKIIIKNKYPFIVNKRNFSCKKFTGLPSIVTNYNKILIDNLKRENEKFFLSPFSIINNKKFSEKYRYYGDKEDNIIKKKEKENFKSLKVFKIKKEIKEEIEKMEKTEKKTKNINSKKLLYSKFKNSISKAALHFKRLKITIKEFYSEYKLKNYSFSNPETKNLLFQIKENNRILAEKILDENKSCSLDYDILKRTPLHWSSMRNLYQIIPKIINYGADIEAKDFLGKTSLHLAVINNNFEAIIYLLLFYANPFTLSNSGKKAIDYSQNNKITFVLKRAILLHIIHIIGNKGHFFENVQRGFSFFVVNECKNDLQPEAFAFVKGMAEMFRKNLKR